VAHFEHHHFHDECGQDHHTVGVFKVLEAAKAATRAYVADNYGDLNDLDVWESITVSEDGTDGPSGPGALLHIEATDQEGDVYHMWVDEQDIY
jgi:hypothetical protein